VPQWLNFTLNIGAALLMGVAIGLERQWGRHPAGLRTNALVTLGAAIFVSLVGLVGGEGSPTRVAGQVVTGIGFLGGGVILREGLNVRGLNTAATLWCSAAVGTLAGSGFLLAGAIATAAVLFVHVALRPVVRWIEAHAPALIEVETHYRVRVTCRHAQEAVLRSVFLRHINSQPRMTLQGLSTEVADDNEHTVVIAEAYALERNDRFMEQLVSRIGIEPGVVAVSWEKLIR
jgi:putative Mg2+ transporter-C (MgtC) family protein